MVVVLINPNFVTGGFCGLGCITPSEEDDLQILLNSMLVKGFSSIIEDQTRATHAKPGPTMQQQLCCKAAEFCFRFWLFWVD